MFNKNVYKMTVVCCNYAVASYLLSVTITLPPGNRRRAFYWEKYRRSAGDSCIANEPPENPQWNTPIEYSMALSLSLRRDFRLFLASVTFYGPLLRSDFRLSVLYIVCPYGACELWVNGALCRISKCRIMRIFVLSSVSAQKRPSIRLSKFISDTGPQKINR